MDFKVRVLSPEGGELTPCSVEKAKELCDRGKALLSPDGTSIRLLEGQYQTGNRLKQLSSLMTAKNIFEHRLARIEIAGGPASGKTFLTLTAVKILPTVASSTTQRIGYSLFLYKTEAVLQSFIKRLEQYYKEQTESSSRSFVSIDYDQQAGLYLVNRNDIFSGGSSTKSRMFTVIPLSTTELKPQILNRFFLKQNYAIIADDVEEPGGDLVYSEISKNAVLTIATRTTRDEADVSLRAYYR